MGLINKTAADNNAEEKFESMEDASATTTTSNAADKVDAKPAANADNTAPASTKTAVAPTVAKTSVVVRQPAGAALAEFKDALTVEYNTLTAIIPNQGNFVERETKKVLGDTIVFDLISFQDTWVVDPGDDKAPKDVVKYSNDGKVTTEGIPVEEALQDMLNRDYSNARIKQRCVVVGGVVMASKTQEFNDELVQFDLSPRSKVQFDRFRAKLMYKVRIGKAKVGERVMVKAMCELKTQGSNTYTEAVFSLHEDGATA